MMMMMIYFTNSVGKKMNGLCDFLLVDSLTRVDTLIVYQEEIAYAI